MFFQKKYWRECYKIGLQIFNTPKAPQMYDDEEEVIDTIHEYAYYFADACIQSYKIRFPHWWNL